MSVLSKEDLMNSLKSIIGENASDESITFLENVSDTIDDFETRTAGQTDWKTKYEENDRAWRNRYTERFFLCRVCHWTLSREPVLKRQQYVCFEWIDRLCSVLIRLQQHTKQCGDRRH